MSQTPTPEGRTDEEPLDVAPGELAHEDDTVIGVAFRRSLIVLVALSLIAITIRLLVGGDEEVAPVQEVDYVPPRAVERTVVIPQLPFVDVTLAAGIDFVRHDGAVGDKRLPETMGGGVAFLDAENDGDADLFLVDGRPWEGDAPPEVGSRLYLNDGGGQFTDGTRASGLDDRSTYGMGVAVGDVEGDGDSDLLVTAVGPNRFWTNTGGGQFTDGTAASGLAGSEGSWSNTAGFFDADNDGDLDLFVCNYVRWSPEIDREVNYTLVGVGRAYGPPTNYEGDQSTFYRNAGDGTFTDDTEGGGFVVTNPTTDKPAGKALGLGIVDIDADGWIDVFVANDTVRNFFFRNQGDGTFAEEGVARGVAFDRSGSATGAMGVDVADYRGDGALSVAIGNFANEMSSLYVLQPSRSHFADESIVEGIGAPSRLRLSFGLFFFDADLDGRLDLVQANGHLEEEINQVQASQHYEQPSQLFWNCGPDHSATFTEVPAELCGDLARPIVGRGAAFADIDADGDLDVILTQTRGAPLLVRNDQAHGHHWLRVELEGTAANRAGIGAWVELDAGGQTQRQQVMPTRSYLSQVEAAVTFGLGNAEKVDALRVRWPGGAVQEVAVDGVDRVLNVIQN